MDAALLKKAQDGDADAQRQVGDAYYFGNGDTAQDQARAIEWYRRAAEQGQAESQFNIGRCYDVGTGVARDTVQAIEWYRKAAGKGHAAAQNNLGLLYRSGEGLEKNTPEALYWFRKAADKGDPAGQHNLADMYLRGEGIEQDFAAAVSWFTKSAEQGHPGSQFFLGWCYQNGKGVAASTAEAIIWYEKAAKQGNKHAIEAMDALSTVTPLLKSYSVTYGKEPTVLARKASNPQGNELLIEVDKRQPDILKALRLIKEGAALDGRDTKGRTPLILAAWRGHDAIVQALLRAHAPLENKDNLGNTALIFAAWQGHVAIVKLLLDAGADVQDKNNKGYTALICATSNGHADVARCLTEGGASDAAANEDDDPAPPKPVVKAVPPAAKKGPETRARAYNRERLLKRLDMIVGQQDVKARIGNFFDRVELDRARQRFGLPSNKVNLNMVFTGNPGTGKTTVARLLGDMFREAGLLSKGHLVETSASEILGAPHVGESAQRMIAKVAAAEGGVLFIDEAYNFTQYKGSRSDMSAEATEVLLRAMTDEKRELLIVVAGYEDEIQKFLTENQGLKSRFQTFLRFQSYTAEELASIYVKMTSQADYLLADGCKEALARLMPMAPEKYARTFGNARYVKNLFDETLKVLSVRVAENPNPTREDVSLIRPDDLQKAFENIWVEPRKKPLVNKDGSVIDLPPVSVQPRPVAASQTSGFDELEALVGLDGVKKTLRKTAYEMQFFKDRSAAGLPVARSTRHFIFSGNPGTGKTTVARILGRILKEIGYLEQGQVIETTGFDLIGQYVGQTGPQTASRVANAMGGILFIDEAYSLIPRDHSNFTQDAIATLLKLMEDYRDKFVVVAAGYTKEMAEFLDTNPGLKSRFTDFITFDDYGAAELEQIYLKLAKDFKYVLADGAAQELKIIMAEAPAVFVKNFPNGRFVRNLFEDTVKNLASRVAPQALAARRTGQAFGVEALTVIEKQDLAEAWAQAKGSAGSGADEHHIGFRLQENA